MNVFVVQKFEKYEGSEILGVFDSVEFAQRAHPGNWHYDGTEWICNIAKHELYVISTFHLNQESNQGE